MVWGTHKLSVGIRNEDGLLKFIHCAGTDILYNNNDNKRAFRLLEFCETPAENYTLFQVSLFIPNEVERKPKDSESEVLSCLEIFPGHDTKF